MKKSVYCFKYEEQIELEDGFCPSDYDCDFDCDAEIHKSKRMQTK